jgi:transcriptional regulator with GAF, ATPase, and Fis domain
MVGRTLVDVRLICSSSRPMLPALASGEFREDLYYRLAVVPSNCPLRNRGGDIEALAQSFCAALPVNKARNSMRLARTTLPRSKPIRGRAICMSCKM